MLNTVILSGRDHEPWWQFHYRLISYTSWI